MRGKAVSISGTPEILQQCYIRLSTPRGSFSLDKTLGSRFNTLPRTNITMMQELAYEYALEALEDMQGAVVRSCSCSYNIEKDAINISLEIEIGGEIYNAEVQI